MKDMYPQLPKGHRVSTNYKVVRCVACGGIAFAIKPVIQYAGYRQYHYKRRDITCLNCCTSFVRRNTKK